MGRGMAWLDTGTPDSLLRRQLHPHLEHRQGSRVGCLKKCLAAGWIDDDQLENVAPTLKEKRLTANYLLTPAQ